MTPPDNSSVNIYAQFAIRLERISDRRGKMTATFFQYFNFSPNKWMKFHNVIIGLSDPITHDLIFQIMQRK